MDFSVVHAAGFGFYVVSRSKPTHDSVEQMAEAIYVPCCGALGVEVCVHLTWRKPYLCSLIQEFPEFLLCNLWQVFHQFVEGLHLLLVLGYVLHIEELVGG